MSFDGGCQPAIAGDFTGAVYQYAKDLIVRDNRDYIFFYARNTSDTAAGYYLIFADDLGFDGTNFYHPNNQDTYYIEHIVDNDPDNPQDYWTINYYTNTNIGVTIPVGTICYGSPKAYPDLRSGVYHYAYFFACLFVGCCCWVLVDRIFRRLY